MSGRLNSIETRNTMPVAPAASDSRTKQNARAAAKREGDDGQHDAEQHECGERIDAARADEFGETPYERRRRRRVQRTDFAPVRQREAIREPGQQQIGDEFENEAGLDLFHELTAKRGGRGT